MGEQNVSKELDKTKLRVFMQKLLTDLRALEKLIDDGKIERGVRRIGAEQELFLVGPHLEPAKVAMDVLPHLDPAYFTTELGRFNLEFNLDPISLGGRCLHQMEEQIQALLAQVQEAAHRYGTEVILTGILPTLDKRDLSLDNMTPKPRYFALNEAINRLRGSDFQFRIKGTDELIVSHSNVMLEACNTSFQVHFQVGAQEFAHLYNVAQAVTAPVLAAATNSPLLFGKRLWRETRIALFQQSIDTRSPSTHVRELSPRVSFGRRWVERSVLEILQEDIARFRVLLGAEIEENPFDVMDQGLPPKLSALRLHNSTVYRWNRPCYGISEGKPHLRIENRVLPSGPSPLDEVANAALWFGLMRGVSESLPNIATQMDFDDAKENFLAAARLGLNAQLTWPERGRLPAQSLILEELLPLAHQGLAELGIDSEDIDRYLGVIQERVEARRTGAQWLLESLSSMGHRGTRAERMAALTSATIARQNEGQPVHTWRLAELDEAGGWQKHFARIEQIMTTDLFTVNQDELVDLVASLMDWEHIRHVPVEDNEHRLVGLVSHRTLLRLMAKGRGLKGEAIPVSEIMHRNVVVVNPETSTIEAIDLMKRHRIGCLPVCKDDRLVGIVTERDFMNMAGQLLESVLSPGTS